MPLKYHPLVVSVTFNSWLSTSLTVLIDAAGFPSCSGTSVFPVVEAPRVPNKKSMGRVRKMGQLENRPQMMSGPANLDHAFWDLV